MSDCEADVFGGKFGEDREALDVGVAGKIVLDAILDLPAA